MVCISKFHCWNVLWLSVWVSDLGFNVTDLVMTRFSYRRSTYITKVVSDAVTPASQDWYLANQGWYSNIAPSRNSLKNGSLLLKKDPASRGIRTGNFSKRPLAGETRDWSSALCHWAIPSPMTSSHPIETIQLTFKVLLQICKPWPKL